MSTLTTDDDAFHPPTSDDPWWTETAWFSWSVPDRGLLGSFYPVFRPNLGVQFGGIVLLGDDTVPPWEEPLHDLAWHNQIPPGMDLRDVELPNSMYLRALDPGHRYAFGYRGRDLHVDLVATAVTEALVTRDVPPLGAGHIDQFCHVVGHMVLAGERVAVDCLAIRDRAWGRRQDGRQPRCFYDYAIASPDLCFVAAGMHHEGRDQLTTGFFVQDGTFSKLVRGERHVERDERHHVAAVTVDAVDELGRELHATGTTRSRHLFQGYPSMICWMGLADWQLDGQPALGEDQDVFSRRGWRALRSR